jgi:DNA-directed RNA polymerase subunit M/transcription elongation factor TFIIS
MEAPDGSAKNPIVVSSSETESDSHWTSVTDFELSEKEKPASRVWRQIRYIPEDSSDVVWELDDEGRLKPYQFTVKGEMNAYCYQHHFEHHVVEAKPQEGKVPPFLERERKKTRTCRRCKSENVMIQRVQTRTPKVDDDGMTEFYTCMNCKNKWK